ncbi:MAG: hypothetical protein U0R69_10065 [Gaiellales bacterium]
MHTDCLLGYGASSGRDKVSLDLVWLCDEALEDLENLPPPDVIAQGRLDPAGVRATVPGR